MHFSQADTLVPQVGMSVAYDRYAYTRNNPIRFNDPLGHDVGCPGQDASKCGTSSNSNQSVSTSIPSQKFVVGGGSSIDMSKSGFKLNGSDPAEYHMTVWNEKTLPGYDIIFSQYPGYEYTNPVTNKKEVGDPSSNSDIGKAGQAKKLFSQVGSYPNILPVAGYSSSTHAALFFTELRSKLGLKTNLILLGPPGYEDDVEDPLAWDYNGSAMYREDFIDRVLNLSPDLVQILIYDDDSGNWSEIEKMNRVNITYKYYGTNGSGNHHEIDDDPFVVAEAYTWLQTR